MNKIKYFITLTSIALVVVIFSGLSYADDDYIYLQIMYTNDTHGGIAPSGAWFMNPEFPPPLGGWGSLAEYIKIRREDMKDKGAHSLLLDAGDCFTGTPIGTKTEGMAVINAMNMLGYDAMAIGNHEFDKGYWALEKMIKTANFPIMAANIIDSRTGKKPDHIKG
ncbi:MAG: multifunctional 2',3'-cyclic-nucleotide 2'-phosphodiesterase/5'-nucleotidase/3'-nucleotidase, partial [candidate division Zixibacteria bacterium]|nr:multifunctional 2',3'-cyclic-nucleotide 2'-phosphodiesterase/5'-nucleotidase/3'-nucleotidase [candidate division Zixibacteria bacterium]